MTLTHLLIETDLEKAKDGRWVLLIEPDLGAKYEDGAQWDQDHVPPAVMAKWIDDDGMKFWAHLQCAHQGEGFSIHSAKGFVELSDLGLDEEEPDEPYIEVASDGTAELVHPDGQREPAPDGWESMTNLKAERLA
ncbi:hypothetical protein [Paracoccus litorisediminis]|uniref:Uncharacterized protein n=1 Tax=Paracoccus litorisediminis TaxID=2006130 RepID=A0A844HQ20_9RHOB|nr:hypothetical protein [Paracoccus litorisediminis]MTH61158.1 hypothetical protein [Paracoccus litorisediminis]